MAESIIAPKEESISKTVQELIQSDKALTELGTYMYKGSDGGVLDAFQPEMRTPLIDLGLLKSSSSAGREELKKLRSVLTSWGCFQVINHGITAELLDKVREVTKKFFQLPAEEKQKYSREVGTIEGYGRDMILSEHQSLDWIDRLYLTVHPEDQRKLKFWPENPETFREIQHKYFTKLQWVAVDLLKTMAKSLDLEDNCFLDQYGEGTMSARFNFYPPCPRPDLVLGLKPHADGSAITILLQDKEVESLQFLKDDQWYRSPVIPQALLINLGDQVEIMSNGVFKSPVHRVVTNLNRERISLAVFCVPDSDKLIEPIDKLISETRPRLYKPMKNYANTYFRYYYQLGRRPIEAARI